MEKENEGWRERRVGRMEEECEWDGGWIGIELNEEPTFGCMYIHRVAKQYCYTYIT